MNVGILGLGAVASFYLQAIERDPAFTLVAACDVNEAAFAKLSANDATARFTDATKMLDAGLAEAVIVALPNDLHRDAVLAALDRGIHVCCEKPLAIAASDAITMETAAHATGVTLFTAFHRRYNRNLRNLLARMPAAHEVVNVAVRYSENIGEHSAGEEWYLDVRRCGGGCLIDNGPNALDMARQVIGPIELEDATIGDLRYGAEFFARLSLLSAGDVPVNIELDWGLPDGEIKDVTVTLEDGNVLYADMLEGFTGFKSSLSHEYAEIMADFRTAIRSGGSWRADGSPIVRLVEGAYRIARQKEPRLRTETKLPTAARVVKVLFHLRDDRGMRLSPWQSRCFSAGEVHELVTTTDAPAGTADRIDHVGFLGFVEFQSAAVIERTDEVFVGDCRIGTVIGFDECHFPNHYNILISVDNLITAADIFLRPGDEIRFAPATYT
jgi:L-arabinose 1- dehydrogenase